MRVFNIDDMTEKEKWRLSAFCEDIIESSSKCQHCALCRGKMCFFASECVRLDFRYYTEDIEDINTF